MNLESAELIYRCPSCGFRSTTTNTEAQPADVAEATKHLQHNDCHNATLHLVAIGSTSRDGERLHTWRYDSIYVIQSLRDCDKCRTGETLYYEILKPHAERINKEQQRSLVVKLDKPETKTEFLNVLQEIADECEARNGAGSPILQIDAHGSRKGIQVTNDERVLWEDMIDPLTRINKISRMNLLAVLATCFGQHLFSILRPGDRSPAWAIVTPEGWIGDKEVQDGYREFYSKLLTSGAQAGWESLNEYAFVFRSTAEQAFGEYYRGVTESPQTPKSLALRLHDPLIFNCLKDAFLMLDLFPENAARFPISFNDVMGDTSS